MLLIPLHLAWKKGSQERDNLSQQEAGKMNKIQGINAMAGWAPRRGHFVHLKPLAGNCDELVERVGIHRVSSLIPCYLFFRVASCGG